MFSPDLVRVVMAVVFAFTAGACSVRAFARRSTVRIMLAAYGITCTAMFLGQLSLFGTPFTIRTFLSAAAATGDLMFVVSLFRHGPPVNPEP